MWAEVNGERKKVACGPCIRGHRSSKCDHRDRVLVEVRKPGRPLSSCPHPSGSCSCERVVINYTIPKTSECACPSDRPQPAVVAGTSTRVQKSRHRKSLSAFNPSVLEKALKAEQDVETDSSSMVTRTPTSDANSLPSSASSTPRIGPAKEPVSAVAAEPETSSTRVPQTAPTTKAVSSCCQPKPAPPKTSSCCGGKTTEPPKAAPPVKSCCSGSKPSLATRQKHQNTPMQTASISSNFPQQASQLTRPFQPQLSYSSLNNGSFAAGHPPFNFNTPIYNHVGSAFDPRHLGLSSMAGHVAPQSREHNCHCGDSCSCFGCAAHPNNATMMEYIRSMHQYMSTGNFGTIPPPTYDLPTYPHHAGYGAEAGLAYDDAALGNFVASSPMNYAAPMNRSMSIASAWHNSAVNTPLQDARLDVTYFDTSTSQVATPIVSHDQSLPPTTMADEFAVQSPTFADSPDAGKDDEQATLSPSSYFWQEVVLPGCNDATGTCQCGDGCECVGCLTHGGHNGVPLESTVVTAGGTGADAFAAGFGGPHEHGGHDVPHFAQFTAGRI